MYNFADAAIKIYRNEIQPLFEEYWLAEAALSNCLTSKGAPVSKGKMPKNINDYMQNAYKNALNLRKDAVSGTQKKF